MQEKEKILVIVESPTKAKTLSRFLPSKYTIHATIGHIRDLPQSATEIPSNMKDQAWTRLGIDVENNFKPLYVLSRGKSSVVRELKKASASCSKILLATDEDREGESICWHLMEILKPEKETKRITFHEITREAIEQAVENPREINMQLVRAQETRRILDRLYGYTLSPLIWKKIAYGLSAGRVQSPALCLIIERERERIRFKSSEYWDIKARLTTQDGTKTEFDATLRKVDDMTVAASAHFDSVTGEFTKKNTVRLLEKEETEKLCESLKKAEWEVIDVSSKDSTARPSPPYITSTLQQEGNRKLGLSTRQTMRIAQQLYEKGLITYMRTDSPTLSQEAIRAARKSVTQDFGDTYLSKETRQYTARSRQSQEAHEAIRPAGVNFRNPKTITFDSTQEAKLYTMIYQRTLASQMADAKKRSFSVLIKANNTVFNATATVVTFPGFLLALNKAEAAANAENIGNISVGTILELLEIEALEHHTKPPARYNEASLVQKLESLDIGRPSTYSSIISTLYERKYAQKNDNAIIPTFIGIAVIQFLEEHFKYLIEYKFTSKLEESLDKIAHGQLDSIEYLQEFYQGDVGLQARVQRGEGEIKPEPCRVIHLPYDLSENTQIRIGRYGAYVSMQEEDKEITFSIPEDTTPEGINKEYIEKLAEIEKQDPPIIGTDPESGKTIYCLYGRYGYHLVLGEVEEGSKPKRAKLDIPPEDVTVEYAMRLLSLPRTLGQHPESGKDIKASIGPYGPYIVHDGDYRSLKEDDVHSIELERALEILAQPKKVRGNFRRKKTRK